MDRWYNRFKELSQGMQYVEVWNSVMMQCAEKVEGEETILS
jgi:alanyl-tRNA synthetase